MANHNAGFYLAVAIAPHRSFGAIFGRPFSEVTLSKTIKCDHI
jgi:hypothetical protein